MNTTADPRDTRNATIFTTLVTAVAGGNHTTDSAAAAFMALVKDAAAAMVRSMLETTEKNTRVAMATGFASDSALDGMSHIPSDPSTTIRAMGFTASGTSEVIVRVEDDFRIQDYVVRNLSTVQEDRGWYKWEGK